MVQNRLWSFPNALRRAPYCFVTFQAVSQTSTSHPRYGCRAAHVPSGPRGHVEGGHADHTHGSLDLPAHGHGDHDPAGSDACVDSEDVEARGVGRLPRRVHSGCARCLLGRVAVGDELERSPGRRAFPAGVRAGRSAPMPPGRPALRQPCAGRPRSQEQAPGRWEPAPTPGHRSAARLPSANRPGRSTHQRTSAGARNPTAAPSVSGSSRIAGRVIAALRGFQGMRASSCKTGEGRAGLPGDGQDNIDSVTAGQGQQSAHGGVEVVEQVGHGA